MGQRRDVDDLGNCDASAMDGADGRFTTIAGTLDVGLDFAQAEVISDLCTVFGCHLSGVGGVLLGTTEPILPAEDHDITCPSLLARHTMMLLNEECTCS